MFVILKQLQGFCKEENNNYLSWQIKKNYFKFIEAKEVQTRY